MRRPHSDCAMDGSAIGFHEPSARRRRVAEPAATDAQITIRALGAADLELLESADVSVFDDAVQPPLASEFLADPRHHIVVALAGDDIVGFASGVHYVHPDKPAEMFVNEVGVTPPYRRRGIARALLERLFEVGRGLGCRSAWVATETNNAAALALYRALDGAEDRTPVIFSFDLEPARAGPREERQRPGREALSGDSEETEVTMSEGATYPDALDPDLVGTYPALAKAGGGYVWDAVLEYRVWCSPRAGAPDEADGNDYYYAFATHAEALAFSADADWAQEPLALILQEEYIDEPQPGRYVHVREKRIAEWPVAFLARPRRRANTIPDFVSPNAPANRLDIIRGVVK